MTTELVLNMVRLQHEELNKSLASSPLIFKNVMGLVEQFPWSNMLQIRVMRLADQILLPSNDKALKAHFLESSGLAKSLSKMSQQAWIT
mmetsp:Transcript_33503/g.51465  ORF Transcript_33503/g.51465 Transcript_33503/m.51465 type:complete len:89 (+) Transcript_33503:1240-1506(+)